MKQGCLLAFERLKAVLELSAGSAVGALVSKQFKEKFPDAKKVGVILCGGNVAPETLLK